MAAWKVSEGSGISEVAGRTLAWRELQGHQRELGGCQKETLWAADRATEESGPLRQLGGDLRKLGKPQEGGWRQTEWSISSCEVLPESTICHCPDGSYSRV